MYNNTYNSHKTHISCNIQECEWQVLGITLRTRRLCWSLRSRTECDSFVLQTCEIWCSLHFLVVDYKHCSYWILLICVRNHHTHIIYIHIIHIYIYIYMCVSHVQRPHNCQSTEHFIVSVRQSFIFSAARFAFALLTPMTWTKGPYFRSCPKHLVLNRRRRSFHNASATIPASRRILTSTVPPSRPCSSVAWGCGSMWEDIRGCDYRNS